MHRRVAAGDLAAEGGGKGLVAKTHAQNGKSAGCRLYEIDGNAGVLGKAGAGREHDALRLALDDRIDACRVIAHDVHLGAHIGQEMPQIPGEAVIVVDEYNHVADPAGGCVPDMWMYRHVL